MIKLKKSILVLFLFTLTLALFLSGCSAETPPVEEETGATDNADVDTMPSIEAEIIGTWQISAVWVHGDARQEYTGEISLIFAVDGTVELIDNNNEEPLIYSGSYYVENDKVYTVYTSVNQESFEVSEENMNGVITIDSDTGELVYDYVNDSNGLTWYFTKK